MQRLILGFGLLSAAILLPVADAEAQTKYPTQPVKIVAANTTGTAVDILTRILAQGLGEHFGQPFVVENRPGGGGTIGADAVARSPADGYTLLVVSPPLQVITPNLRKNLPYDPIKSFKPISLFATTDNVMIAHPKMPNTLKGLVDFAKANPGKLRVSNGGVGFQGHLSILMFANQAGIDVMHVPYKGAASVQGVVSGEADMTMGPLPLVSAAIRAGTVNAIAVASLKRSPHLPDVPTLDESGIEGFESGGWTGLTAPAGVPEEIIAQLSDAVNHVLQNERVRAQITAAGGTPWGTTPEEATRVIETELESYGKIIRDNNIQVD